MYFKIRLYFLLFPHRVPRVCHTPVTRAASSARMNFGERKQKGCNHHTIEKLGTTFGSRGRDPRGPQPVTSRGVPDVCDFGGHMVGGGRQHSLRQCPPTFSEERKVT